MASTQNPDLAVLTQGSSIEPIKKHVLKSKLMFGVVDESHNDNIDPRSQKLDNVPKHVAFGFPQTVSMLRKRRQVC